MTAEVFVFLGEFGYELLDWQGRLRRYARTRTGGGALICAGRPGVDALYEFADAYLDVSACAAWQASTSIQMTAMLNPRDYRDPANAAHLDTLKAEVAALVTDRIGGDHRLYFSCDRHRLGDVALGSGTAWIDTQIYDLLAHWENDYALIDAPEDTADTVLERAGVDPSEPFVLAQFREREGARPGTDLEIAPFLKALRGVAPVRFIEFSSSRAQDSHSRTPDDADVSPIPVQNLAEQGAVIRRAAHCVFFSTGDIGTHFYLPPFFDRDVTAVAPAACFALGTSPIELWNEAVFPGCGRIRPEPVGAASPAFTAAAVTERLVHEAAWRVWLDGLQGMSGEETRLLWPNTPISRDIQNRIKARVGAADVEAHDPRSRPARIIAQLERAVSRTALCAEFGLLDLACGDGIILALIKRAFPNAHVFGLDCNTGSFPDHDRVRANGVRLYKGWLQHLSRRALARPFDVVMMLNTYRDWKAAQLGPEDRDLPTEIDDFLRRHARHAVLTLTPAQQREFEADGWTTEPLGGGEDDSLMVFMTNSRLDKRPGGPIPAVARRCTGTVDTIVHQLQHAPGGFADSASAIVSDIQARLNDGQSRATRASLKEWYATRKKRIEPWLDAGIGER